MPEDGDLRRDLLDRIDTRRAGVRRFLRQNGPRIRRRSNITVVLSSLAAVFTAGPAFGGESFSGAVQHALRLSSDSYVWRVLCLAALVVSVGAALMTNIGRSQDAVARLSAAEAASTELEGLATLLQYGHLSPDDGAKLYQQYTTKIPFVEDTSSAEPAPAGRRPSPSGA